MIVEAGAVPNITALLSDVFDIRKEVLSVGSVTIIIENSTNSAITLSCMILSGYLGHVTILIECSLLHAVS